MLIHTKLQLLHHSFLEFLYNPMGHEELAITSLMQCHSIVVSEQRITIPLMRNTKCELV